jgi:hypothetical protein
MSGNTTTIKDPENMKAEPKKFAFDFSYWSHDGYNEQSDGYLEPKDAKYADQVCEGYNRNMMWWLLWTDMCPALF